MHKLALIASAIILGSGVAHAACVAWGPPPGAPGDDGGCLTSDKVKSQCEQKVGGNLANKLVKGTLKCHSKLAAALFKDGAAADFDEEGCEAAGIQKFLDKTDTSGCPCVDEMLLAALTVQQLDDNNNLFYCDPAGQPINVYPIGGDDYGNVPTTKDILKCGDGIAKATGKLWKAYSKCHAKYAKDYQKKGVQLTENEEDCEAEARTAFTAATSALTGCQGCENTAGAVALVELQVNGANGLVYCEQ